MMTGANIHKVEVLVEEALKITHEELYNKSRPKDYAEARMAVWAVAHGKYGYGLTELGRIYTKHHSTILSGIRKVRRGKVDARVLTCVRKLWPTFRITRSTK